MSQSTGVYVSQNYSEPMNAQHNFVNQYDIENPDAAMSVYARIMHEHTKRQLSTATNSARRRSEGSSYDSSSNSLDSVNSNNS